MNIHIRKAYLKRYELLTRTAMHYTKLPYDGKWRRFHREYSLVIDGFPRCGNTFATHAFMLANPEVCVGHHFHAPSIFKYSVRNKIPSLCIFRDPLNCIISNKIYYPKKTLATIQAEYISYYQVILKLPNQVVLSDFETTTSDFGRVIDAVNNKFDTRFNKFDSTKNNVKAVRDIIEKIPTQHRREALVAVERQCTPSDKRKTMKKELTGLITKMDNGDFLKRSWAIYSALKNRSI